MTTLVSYPTKIVNNLSESLEDASIKLGMGAAIGGIVGSAAGPAGVATGMCAGAQVGAGLHLFGRLCYAVASTTLSEKNAERIASFLELAAGFAVSYRATQSALVSAGGMVGGYLAGEGANRAIPNDTPKAVKLPLVLTASAAGGFAGGGIGGKLDNALWGSNASPHSDLPQRSPTGRQLKSIEEPVGTGNHTQPTYGNEGQGTVSKRTATEVCYNLDQVGQNGRKWFAAFGSDKISCNLNPQNGQTRRIEIGGDAFDVYGVKAGNCSLLQRMLLYTGGSSNPDSRYPYIILPPSTYEAVEGGCTGLQDVVRLKVNNCPPQDITVLQSATNGSNPCVPPDSYAYECTTARKYQIRSDSLQGVPLSTIPTGSSLFNAALTTQNGDILLTATVGNTSKTVRAADFIQQLRLLYPNARCEAPSSSSFGPASLGDASNLEFLTPQDLQMAFNHTAAVADNCATVNIVDSQASTYGNVISLQHVAGLMNQSYARLRFAADKLVAYNGSLVHWGELVKHLPFSNIELSQRGCVYDPAAWQQLTLNELIQAHNSAPKVPLPDSTDCSGYIRRIGVYGKLTFDEIEKLFNKFTPNFADQGIDIPAEQQVAFDGGDIRWGQLKLNLPVNKTCGGDAAMQDNPSTSKSGYKGITQADLQQSLRDNCPPQRNFEFEDQSQHPFDISQIPADHNKSNPYQALVPAEPDVLMSDGSQKVVYAKDVLKQLRELEQGASNCKLGLNQDQPDLSLLTLEDLVTAFNRAPEAPATCSKIETVSTINNVVTLEDLLELFNTSTAIRLQDNDLVFNDGKYVKWQDIRQYFDPEFRTRQCAQDTSLLHSVTEPELRQAVKQAPAQAAPVDSKDCSSGITSGEYLLPNSTAEEVIAEFETTFPEFGKAGLKITPELEVEYRGQLIRFADIAAFLSPTRSCQQDAAAYKGITEAELTHAIDCFLQGLSIQQCAEITEPAPTPASAELPSPTQSGVVATDGHNPTGAVLGYIAAVILASGLSAAAALVLWLIQRQLRKQTLDIEAATSSAEARVNAQDPAQLQAVRSDNGAVAIEMSPVTSTQVQRETKAKQTGLPIAAPSAAANALEPLTYDNESICFDACRNGDLTLLKTTFGERDVNTRYHQKRADDHVSLLHIAAAAGRINVVEHLLSRRADLTLKTGRGITALYLAASMGQVSVVNRLLKVNPSLANIANDGGATPLIIAVIKGHTKTISTLLRHGADASVRWNDQTLMEIAQEKNNKDVMSILKDHMLNSQAEEQQS